MTTYLHTTALRGDTEALIEYEVTSWGSDPVTSGPPEACDPGDPIEFQIVGATAHERTVDLTDQETARIEAEIAANPPEPPEPYDDWEDWS